MPAAVFALVCPILVSYSTTFVPQNGSTPLMRNCSENKDYQQEPFPNNAVQYLLTLIGLKVWLAGTVMIFWTVGVVQGVSFTIISLVALLVKASGTGKQRGASKQIQG